MMSEVMSIYPVGLVASLDQCLCRADMMSGLRAARKNSWLFPVYKKPGESRRESRMGS